jgi:hypothetical protein
MLRLKYRSITFSVLLSISNCQSCKKHDGEKKSVKKEEIESKTTPKSIQSTSETNKMEKSLAQASVKLPLPIKFTMIKGNMDH